MRLTARDMAVVRAVYDYRALTTEQIQRLYFGNAGQAARIAQRRLQALYHHRYVFRGDQPHRTLEAKPLVYFLDTVGVDLLCDRLGLERTEVDWHPRHNDVTSLYLDHLLASNDLRIAVVQAAEAHGFVIQRWLDDRSLKRSHAGEHVTITNKDGRRMTVSVVPDGYFRLTTPQDTYNFFVEIDKRTVTGLASKWGRRDWSRKVAAYAEYHRSGGYEARYGTADMRVLTITTGQRRLQNLKVITEETVSGAPVGRFWFTTLERATADSILTGTIWAVGGADNPYSIVGQL